MTKQQVAKLIIDCIEASDERGWSTEFLESLQSAFEKYGKLTERQEIALDNCASSLGIDF